MRILYFVIITSVFTLSFYANEKHAAGTVSFFSLELLSMSSPSLIKFKSYSEDDGIEDGEKEGTNDYKDIAGFTIYSSFSFLFSITGIPLLSIGCYNYSLNYPGEQTLPYIITGAVSLAIGGIMLAFMIATVIAVLVMFKSIKLGSRQKNLNIPGEAGGCFFCRPMI